MTQTHAWACRLTPPISPLPARTPHFHTPALPAPQPPQTPLPQLNQVVVNFTATTGFPVGFTVPGALSTAVPATAGVDLIPGLVPSGVAFNRGLVSLQTISFK